MRGTETDSVLAPLVKVLKRGYAGSGVYIGLILAVGVAIFPLYVFPSGGVQPAHALLGIFVIGSSISLGLAKPDWVKVFYGLAVYIFTREYFYFLDSSNPNAFLSALYFFYNAALAAAIFLFFTERMLTPLNVGVFAASLLIFFSYLLFFIEGGSGRFSSTWNNPNQLGYFSVCLLSVAYLMRRAGGLSYLASLALIFLSAVLAAASLSKAAIIPVAMVILFALKPAVKNISQQSVYFFIGFFAIVGFAILLWSGFLDDFDVVSRIANMADEEDSSLEARGYFALSGADWLSVLFGLGSLGSREVLGHEVHSTLASVAINYGIFGVFIFGLLMSIWVAKIWRSLGFSGLFCIVLPAMLYGLTHNGSRFSFFWILFGVSMAATDRRYRCQEDV